MLIYFVCGFSLFNGKNQIRRISCLVRQSAHIIFLLSVSTQFYCFVLIIFANWKFINIFFGINVPFFLLKENDEKQM